MAPAHNGAAIAESRPSACLPLWQASENLQRLYDLCQELSSTWEALDAEDQERLSDTEAVAGKAVAELEFRLREWKGRSVALEARCKPLLAEAESGVAALGENAGPLASRLAEARKLPVRKRVAALEGVLAAEQLELLGRRPQEAADSGLATLGPQLARLREAVQERRAVAARARASLQALWRELGVQPGAGQDAEDEAIRSGGESFGVPDTEHEVLMRRLAFWDSQRAKRQQQQVLDRHGRIRELALAVLPQSELPQLSAFLEAHANTSDAGPLQAKEQELEARVEVQVRSLDQRRRAASGALGRPVAEPEAKATPLQRFRALAAELDRLEEELKARHNSVHEAARRAKALWEELGEHPDERRDGEVSRVLAAGADSSGANGLDVASLAEAVEASCKAWEARRATAAEELSSLRLELESLSQPEDVRSFLAQHGTLRREDRATCRSRIQQLRAEALRAQEEPKKDRLRRLYDLCGLGAGAIEALYVSLEQAADAEQRSSRLSQELETMERYAESVSSIVGQLRELRPEVPRGLQFAAATKDPGFRKAVARRGSEYRSRLLEAIGQWEAESRKPFLYDGANVKEWLLAIGPEETHSGGGVPAAQAAAPAMPAELEAAAAKAMAALKAKLAAVKSMPPPFAMDGSGDGDDSGDAAKGNGPAGKGEQEKTEKEEKKKKKEKKDKSKKKKADRSKSRKRKGSDESSESKKRKRSRKKPPKVSSSESQSEGSTGSQTQPKKKKKKAHSHRHNRRSKSKSRRRGK